MTTSKFEINRSVRENLIGLIVTYESDVPDSKSIFQEEPAISGQISYTYNLDPDNINNKRYYDFSNAVGLTIYKQK